MLLDDDVFFTAATRLETMLDLLEAPASSSSTTAASPPMLVAGSYTQYNSTSAAPEVNDYSIYFEKVPGKGEGFWRTRRPDVSTRGIGTCHPVHAAHNFFMARTDVLRRYPWHPKLSIFEHEHFFFQLHLANIPVLVCPHVSVFHYRAPNLRESRYAADSLRFKEHLFARHFCDAFPQVRTFTAPFWQYDCERFLLCPQWDFAVQTGMPCVPMEDAWQVSAHSHQCLLLSVPLRALCLVSTFSCDAVL